MNPLAPRNMRRHEIDMTAQVATILNGFRDRGATSGHPLHNMLCPPQNLSSRDGLLRVKSDAESIVNALIYLITINYNNRLENMRRRHGGPGPVIALVGPAAPARPRRVQGGLGPGWRARGKSDQPGKVPGEQVGNKAFCSCRVPAGECAQ